MSKPRTFKKGDIVHVLPFRLNGKVVHVIRGNKDFEDKTYVVTLQKTVGVVVNDVTYPRWGRTITVHPALVQPAT